ncbi:hypothetical protein ACB092_01G128800 [Castanea dentata]
MSKKITQEKKSMFNTLFLVPFHPDRNGRNFLYRYANWYENTSHSTSSQISSCFGQILITRHDTTRTQPVNTSRHPYAWAHAHAVPNAKNNIICLHCHKLIKGGGITRLKYHLVGIRGQVESCKVVSSDHKSYFATRTTPRAQISLRSALDTKVMIDNAKMNVARWWYHSNVPFYVAQSPHYQLMIDSIATVGPGFKGASFYELRGSLLKNIVHEVNDFCLTKDAETLFNILNFVLQEIGVEYIVQLITDNAFAYKKARKNYSKNLILENIANPKWFPLVDEAIKKEKKIIKFIYNHGVVLDLMRQDFTNGRELCHPTITRFATNFLSLLSMLRFKKELRQVFTCDKWLACPHAKTAIGKEISKIVLEDYSFWSQCKNIVKRKKNLFSTASLQNPNIKVSQENKTFTILISVQVYSGNFIHFKALSAGCFLNPAICFRLSFKRQNEVQRGFLSTLMRLVPNPDIQDKISSQLDEYKKSMVSWWEQFGHKAPNLQSFAIRMLSQCCSATGCERINDLVFVHYNLGLRERNIQSNKYALDPISLDNINLMGDWVAEEPALLNPDDIKWDCLNELIALVNVEEEAELETIDVDDDDDDDNNNEHGLTNFPMGPGSSCMSSFDDEFDPFLMDDDEEEE